MTIRSATQFAVIGVSLAFAMRLADPFLSRWITSENHNFESTRLILQVYWAVADIFEYVGLLAFLVTLSRKQRDKASGTTSQVVGSGG